MLDSSAISPKPCRHPIQSIPAGSSLTCWPLRLIVNMAGHPHPPQRSGPRKSVTCCCWLAAGRRAAANTGHQTPGPAGACKPGAAKACNVLLATRSACPISSTSIKHCLLACIRHCAMSVASLTVHSIRLVRLHPPYSPAVGVVHPPGRISTHTAAVLRSTAAGAAKHRTSCLPTAAAAVST